MPTITPFKVERLSFVSVSKFGIIYKYDIIQKTIVDTFIIEQFTFWIILAFVLNFKRKKKPVLYLLISFWIVRILNSLISGLIFFAKKKSKDDHHNKITLFGITCFLYMFCQVIGDWYPVLRTKAVVRNKKSVKLIYITCIIYNLIKLIGPLSFILPQPKNTFSNNNNFKNETVRIQHHISLPEHEQIGDLFGPFSSLGSPEQFDDYRNPLRNIMNNFYKCIGISFFASIVYDISIIYVLRKEVFNKIKIDDQLPTMKKQTFLEKFKVMSEFRIYVSMIVTLIAIPSLAIYIYTFLINKSQNKHNITQHYLFQLCSNIFKIVMKYNYCIMFIDQILLRYYANRKNVIVNSKYNTPKNFSLSSTSLHNLENSYTPRTINYSTLKSSRSSAFSAAPTMDKNNGAITCSNNTNYTPLFCPNLTNFEDTLNAAETNINFDVNMNGEYFSLNKNNQYLYPKY